MKVFRKTKWNRQNKMQKLKSRLNGLIQHLRSVRKQCNRRYESGNVWKDKRVNYQGMDP